jgi:AraC-like DNA-binding protein
MIRHLALDYFDLPETQKFHVYRINASETSQTPHTHDFYQICYVDRGEIQHWQDNEPVNLLYGDAFIVPPGFVHRLVFPNEDAFIYSLSFHESLFHPGFCESNVYRFMTALKLDTIEEKRINIRMKLVLDENQRYIIKSLFESLIREQEAAIPPQLGACGSLIAAIMCVLSQAYFRNDDSKGRLDDVAQYTKTMQECLEYIDSHYTSSLTLEGLARRFALSRTMFGMLFPQFTGTTLKPYITEKRISHAVMLVQNEALSLNEIALMVGYQSFSTFYRNFKKMTGLSPSQYRENSRLSREAE